MPTKTFFELSSKKKERILQTAYHLFGTTPYEKVSIQAIIEGSGIPRGSFYQYFTDKEDLYLYCLLENSRKSLEIVYQENMDFIFHSTLLGEGTDNFSAPWYQKAISDMEASLTEEELYFSKNHPSPPETLQCSFYSRFSLLMYPLLQRHIGELQGVSDKQKRECLLFLVSQITLLTYQYEKIKGISHEEAVSPVQSMIRAVYESFLSPGSPGRLSFLNSLSSLHFLSCGGLDLTVTLAEGNIWECRADKEWTTYQAALSENSLSGSFPLAAERLSETISENASYIQLHVYDDHRFTFCIATAGKKYRFDAPSSAIGVTLDDRRVCVADNGKCFL